MGGKRSRRRAWFYVGLAAVAALVGWRAYRGRQGPLAIMNDGRPLVLKGVTFGTRHTNSLSWGNKLAPYLNRIPWPHFAQRFIPQLELPGSWTDCVFRSEPHLVLWLAPIDLKGQTLMAVPPRRSWAVPPPRAPTTRSGPAARPLRWQIIGPGGTAHGGSAFLDVSGLASQVFQILDIDSYPRRLPNFTVGVFEKRQGDPVPTLVGEFPIRNPQPSKAPFWRAGSVPDQQEAGGLICTLHTFQPSVPADAPAARFREWTAGPSPLIELPAVNSYAAPSTDRGAPADTFEVAGPWFSFRDDHRRTVVRFRLQSADSSENDWDIRQFLLWDPTGNVSYASSAEWTSIAGGGRLLTCSTLPLWPDDPAWKAQLYLVKTNALPTNRTVCLSGIPFRVVGGTNRFVLETNLFGWRISVRAPDSIINSPTTGRSFWPGTIRFEFEREQAMPQALPSPRIRVLQVRDQSGKDLDWTGLRPDHHSDVGCWALGPLTPTSSSRKPTPPVTSVDITLGFPEERTFEFYVPSDAKRSSEAGGQGTTPGVPTPPAPPGSP